MAVFRSPGRGWWLLAGALVAAASLTPHHHQPRPWRSLNLPIHWSLKSEFHAEPAVARSDPASRGLSIADRRCSGAGLELSVWLGSRRAYPTHHQRPPGARLAQRGVAGLDSIPSDTLMQFRIEASLGGDSSVLMYQVRRDRASLPRLLSVGAAWIDSVSLSPQGQVWLPRSEYLTLSVRAVEGADVRVRLPDGTRIRLAARRSRPRRSLPALRAFDWDTTKLRTAEEVRYVGVVRGRAFGPDAGPVLRRTTAALVGVLARAALRCVTGAPCPVPYAELVSPESSWATVEATLGRDTVRARWPLQVALLDTLPVGSRCSMMTPQGREPPIA